MLAYHLQRARPGQGHARPAAQLRAPQAEPQPGQRDRRCHGRGPALGRRARLPDGPALLPPEGEAPRPRSARGFRPLRADRQDSPTTRSFDEAREIVLDAYGDFSPRDGRDRGALLRAKLGGRRAAPRKARRRLLGLDHAERAPLRLAQLHGQPARRHDRRPRARPRRSTSTSPRDKGLFEQDTPLTTAETASVFGEMLVFRRLVSPRRATRRSGSRSCAGSSKTPSPRSRARSP